MDKKIHQPNYLSPGSEASRKAPNPHHSDSHGLICTGAPEANDQSGKMSTPTTAPGNLSPANKNVHQHKSAWPNSSATNLGNFPTTSDVEGQGPSRKHQTLQEGQSKQSIPSKPSAKGRSQAWRPSPTPYIAPPIRQRRPLAHKELPKRHTNPACCRTGQLQASVNISSPKSAEPTSELTVSQVCQETKTTPLETPCPSRILKANTAGKVDDKKVNNPVIMATNDESDVIVLRRGGSVNRPIPLRQPPKENTCKIPQPNPDSSQNRHAGVQAVSDIQKDTGNGTGTHKGDTPTGKLPSKKETPSKEEAMEELNRFRVEIVQQAHLARFKDLNFPTANPEVLERCRTGPGTDPNSDVYLSITKCRLAPNQSACISSATAFLSRVDLEADKPLLSEAEAVAAQWKAYELSPAIYPIVTDGEVTLSSEPTDEQKHIRTQLAYSCLQGGADGQNTGTGKGQKHSWTDIYYANWEYRPHSCSSTYEAFRDWFRRWLDATIQICCYADIYHHAFFDGTAHPDGVRTMYVPDLDDHTTRLKMEDKESRLHQHETVQGYCHNWEIHDKKERDEYRLRREIAREHYLEGLRNVPQPSPSVLKENVYLRPVEVGDVPGLLEIFNWYSDNSPLSSNIDTLQSEDIRQSIDNSIEEKLPFLVATERKIGAISKGSPGRILGYALATDYLGRRTSGRFTAELQLFVKPGHLHKGIGKCLMDKLLEVCDPTYIPKRGYFFDCNRDDHAGYCWIEGWLKSNYNFEEQGQLKGARVKFDRFLNVTYLIRNIGYHTGDRFEP
ncbi:hypothetical protein ETB97_005467 [Aspergillus alliaceus]|uniref:N-acetyltransferase domain-containing protein n=1 Tax=Petromyces alliaceus TaxID=209559 RepID=A0A8H6A088_PETAA|nr:hypothetical protein ETB97_005467 [Aspergillus burnettii]